MAKKILRGTVKGTRRRGRQSQRWEDNIKDWTGLECGESVIAVKDKVWRRRIVETSSEVSKRPLRLKQF